MVNLLTSVILAVWVAAIALLSVQNATYVSLRFLWFQTVQIPLGLLLGLCAAIGMVGMAIAIPLVQLGQRLAGNQQDDTEGFEPDEF